MVRNATVPVIGSTLPALISVARARILDGHAQAARFARPRPMVAGDWSVVMVGTLSGTGITFTVTGLAELADTLELVGVYWRPDPVIADLGEIGGRDARPRRVC